PSSRWSWSRWVRLSLPRGAEPALGGQTVPGHRLPDGNQRRVAEDADEQPREAVGCRPMRPWRLVLPMLMVASTATAAKGKVGYADPKEAQDARLAQAMRQHQILERAAEILKAVRLPKTLTLKAESCGEPNAWYDPDTDIVTFCYELVREMA